jgi:hypothetical protein
MINKSLLVLILGTLSFTCSAQLSNQKFEGQEIKLDLGGWADNFMNAGSTLKSIHYIINDEMCPVQLNAAGILVKYSSSSGVSKYRFKRKGSYTANKEVQAIEIVHVLYDVFGNHISSLSDLIIEDISGTMQLNPRSNWYASDNQAQEFLTSVTFVEAVRLKDGSIWKNSEEGLRLELKKVKLDFSESFMPKEDE